jgi:hypothetical protein
MKKIPIASLIGQLLSVVVMVVITASSFVVAADLTIAPVKDVVERINSTADPGGVVVGSEIAVFTAIERGGNMSKMVKDQKSFLPQFSVTGKKVAAAVKTVGEEDGKELLFGGGDLFYSETGEFLGKAEPIKSTFTFVASAISSQVMKKGMTPQPGIVVADPFGFKPMGLA